MNIFNRIKEDIINAIKADMPEVAISNFTVEPPKDPSHGCISTNIAMVTAKKLGSTPQKLGEEIASKFMQSVDYIESYNIAKQGFINFVIKKHIWYDTLKVIIKENLGFGNSELGKGKRVNIEYVSANPTGPLHIGHTRPAVFGDALAMLLIKTGYEVTKEYYINDAGSQIDVLAESCYLRYREAFGEKIEIPEGLYPGDYLVAVGEGLKQQYGNELLDMPKENWMPIVKQFAIDVMMALIKEDLEQLAITHDSFVSEYKLHKDKKIEEAVKLLEQKSLVYKGILEAPKGKKPDDWEEREQLLFKSTEFGDDIDRPLQKSDGSWTYFAADLSYMLDKIERGFTDLILILGADHGGYVKRMQAALKALTNNTHHYDIKLCQLVNFMVAGKPYKMSKRAGTFITARDVIDEVGKDIIRFMMLTRKNDITMDFDFEKVKEQSKDNPVFYVQYAHARAKSVIRNAREEMGNDITSVLYNIDEVKPDLLSHEDELLLIKYMAEWPRLLESASLHHEPHRIAFYLYELASKFHAFWNKGRDDKELRFILKDNVEMTKARLVLVQAIANVIASGLFIFSVNPVEEM